MGVDERRSDGHGRRDDDHPAVHRLEALRDRGHEAPVEDFPRQPSQKDGLGRMCKTHWNEYTAGLARDAKARKAAEVSGRDGGWGPGNGVR